MTSGASETATRTCSRLIVGSSSNVDAGTIGFAASALRSSARPASCAAKSRRSEAAHCAALPRGPRQVHRRFSGRSCPSLISSVAVNPDALCRSENWAKRAKVRRLVGSGGPLTIYLRKRRLRTANHGGRPLTIRLKGLIASPLLSQIVQSKTIRRSRRAP